MSAVSTRDGMRMCVEDRGVGPPLLLVHGFTGCAAAWGSELKDELAKHCRTLCVDLLGHGGSDKPERPERYALEALVADLCEVLTARGIPRALWAGYSMGGRIALGAAVLQPERVSGLVLEGTSPGLDSEEERRERIANDERLARLLEDDGIERFVEHWMRLPLFRSQQRLGKERLALERARRLHNSPRALAACLRGVGLGVQPSLWSALPRVRVPTLLVVGEEDAKFRGIAARMARALPRSRTRILPQAGHTTHLECAPLYLDALTRFCAQASQKKGEAPDEGRMDLRA